jgi:hypothetical protein
MKIEIKPFNDRVRFNPAITFIRLKNRANALKPVHCLFGHDTRRKISTPAGIYFNS